jgi:hypothetical protein
VTSTPAARLATTRKEALVSTGSSEVLSDRDLTVFVERSLAWLDSLG